jgi:hypothetical protein
MVLALQGMSSLGRYSGVCVRHGILRGNVGLLLVSLRMFEYYRRDSQESCGVFPMRGNMPHQRQCRTPTAECPT